MFYKTKYIQYQNVEQCGLPSLIVIKSVLSLEQRHLANLIIFLTVIILI